MRWAVACIALGACHFDPGGAGTDAPARADARALHDAAPGLTDAPPDAPVATGPDAVPGVPDLVMVAAEITSSAYITYDYFGPDACEVVEGCIGATGTRRLLRFNSVTANLGTGDLALGPTPPPGVSSGIFVWSPCHKHHHVPGFEDYALVGPNGVIAGGHKQSYCLRDDERERWGAPSSGYTCTDQGISAGWADVYQPQLACQWIDVTDVPPGQYTVRITVNPTHEFVESDYGNDDVEFSVLL